jgi:hypothetical protein
MAQIPKSTEDFDHYIGTVTQTVEDGPLHVNVLVLVNVHVPGILVLSGTFTLTSTCRCMVHTHFL